MNRLLAIATNLFPVWVLLGGALAWLVGVRSARGARWISLASLAVALGGALPWCGASPVAEGLAGGGRWLAWSTWPWIPQLGISVFLGIDGLSLLPSLLNPNAPWRDTTLVQTGSARTAGRNPGWEFRGVQTSRYLLAINAKGSGGNYLFDRKKDPYERRNVIDSSRYRPVVKELRRRYRVLADCNGQFSCNRRFGPLPKPRHR